MQFVNEKIRAQQVQLIDHLGENHGLVSRDQALEVAREANLDAVQIAESGKYGVPIVKIMDFGKSLYEKRKKQVESKKHQKIIHVKEIKFRPHIGEHDYQTKINQAIKFLKNGKRVKVTLFFRGRENITKIERGAAFFARIDDTFNQHGLLSDLVQEGESKMGQYWSRIYYLKMKK